MNNKLWPIDMVGVLPDDRRFQEKFGKHSVFRNHMNVIQFNLKMISRPPNQFPNVEYFTGFSHDLEKWGFEDNVYLKDEARIARLRSFLDDMLVVFQPERRLVQENKTVFVAQNIRVIPKSEDYRTEDVLVGLPVFSRAAHGYETDEFFERLKNRKYLGHIDFISNEPEDTPPYILWKDENDNFYACGRFEHHHHAYGGFKFIEAGRIKVIPFEEEWLFKSYQIGNLLYVPLKIIEAIDKKSAEHPAFSGRLATAPPPAPARVSEEGAFPWTEDDELEQAFLDRLVALTCAQGLFYEEKDLYNFHTAMKVSGLVILSGMSGTGKSRLVHAYAKALGLEPDRLAFIPVRPSWTDDADLLGYPDTLHGVYRPGDADLVNLLLEAEKEENRNKLFMVCFDEMNLARVEHYFSQFLSVLEMDGPNRVLRLYNDELAGALKNAAHYKPTVTIGDNVLFVGTVNIDESTFHFSDKVLDRANVIELKVLPYSVLKKEPGTRGLESWEAVDAAAYERMKNQSTAFELTEAEIDFFWSLHQELQNLSTKLGIGPRVIRQIDAYLKNIPKNGVLTRAEALDLQVVQRVLTKVRGTDEMLGRFFGPKKNGVLTEAVSRFIEWLDQFKALSDFKETRRVALQKMKELNDNGFTL